MELAGWAAVLGARLLGASPQGVQDARDLTGPS